MWVSHLHVCGSGRCGFCAGRHVHLTIADTAICRFINYRYMLHSCVITTKNKPRVGRISKSVWLKFRHCLCLDVSSPLVDWSFDYMHTVGGDRDWNRPSSQISDLHDLDLGSGHTTYHRVSLSNLHLQNNYHWNRKKKFCGRTEGRTCRDVRTGGRTLRPALLGVGGVDLTREHNLIAMYRLMCPLRGELSTSLERLCRQLRYIINHHLLSRLRP